MLDRKPGRSYLWPYSTTYQKAANSNFQKVINDHKICTSISSSQHSSTKSNSTYNNLSFTVPEVLENTMQRFNRTSSHATSECNEQNMNSTSNCEPVFMKNSVIESSNNLQKDSNSSDFSGETVQSDLKSDHNSNNSNSCRISISDIWKDDEELNEDLFYLITFSLCSNSCNLLATIIQSLLAMVAVCQHGSSLNNILICFSTLWLKPNNKQSLRKRKFYCLCKLVASQQGDLFKQKQIVVHLLKMIKVSLIYLLLYMFERIYNYNNYNQCIRF